ncbi:unnamed protein product, partial [Meganyctiphanes norvegica]
CNCVDCQQVAAFMGFQAPHDIQQGFVRFCSEHEEMRQKGIPESEIIKYMEEVRAFAYSLAKENPAYSRPNYCQYRFAHQPEESQRCEMCKHSVDYWSLFSRGTAPTL